MENNMNSHSNLTIDVVCISHLRWNFVYQRPQHIMSRFGRNGRVFYIEEAMLTDEQTHLDVTENDGNIFVVVPKISREDENELVELQREMLDTLISSEDIKDYILWFYTPMAMDFAAHLKPKVTVFDCMDELSAFRFAPPELIANEKQLLKKADVVFTGGQSLYEAKKDGHSNIHAFPSSIDKEHFQQARTTPHEPKDQAEIGLPKLGFCGVIDERMDMHLIAELADLRPEWQFIMIGPVVKISQDELPKRSNIHYLGGKNYEDLPAYLSGWNIALMPFAINESTKYISPTKTPEYLAAGLPVISTPIRDVVKPYGEEGLVEIAATAEEFAAAADKIMARGNSDKWLAETDDFLKDISWDKTWEAMVDRILEQTDKMNGKTENKAKAV